MDGMAQTPLSPETSVLGRFPLISFLEKGLGVLSPGVAGRAALVTP